MATSEDVLRFWFPAEVLSDPARVPQQFEWWFRGGADAEIMRRFVPLLERAIAGELDDWAAAPRSRLALVIALDQFSRTVFRDTARAFAQDPKALALVIEGLDNGAYEQLRSPFEKTFFAVRLSHSEDLANHERSVALVQRIADEAPEELRAMLQFSAGQARGHRDVIARFGRHPHRNAVLGRQSTPAELEYLRSGQLVHARSVPG